MSFEYFYNRDGERFNFVKVPQVFFEDELYADLSSDAKLLYALLLQRMGLSFRKGWLDEENRVYIIYTIEEVMQKMSCAKATAVKILKELDDDNGIGLITRKRTGFGKPNTIYVKDFMTKEQNSDLDRFKNHTSEVQNLNSIGSKNELQEVQNLDGSYIDNSYIELNKSFGKGTGRMLGVFGNVNLTVEEEEDLRALMGSDLENYINRLSSYMQSTGKTYSNHKAAIMTWYYRDEKEKTSGPKKRVSGRSGTAPTASDYEEGDHL